MSYSASSQALTPKVLISDKGDTSFCFTLPQSKIILKYIVAKQYGDSIQDVNSQVIHAQDSIVKNYSQRVVILRMMIDNDNAQMTNLNILNETLKLDIAKAQAKTKRQRNQKIIAILIGSVLGIVAVVN